MSNTPKFDDLLAITETLGKEAGRGRDTQIRFLIAVTEAAYQGVIDLTASKHGQDKDDATRLTEHYTKAQSASNMFDVKAPNIRKAVSCTRTAIKLGAWPHGGTGEPLATVNELMNIRSTLRKKPEMVKRLDDAANTFLRYARQQLKLTALIEQDDLEELCLKREPGLASAEHIIDNARKSLQKLYNGTAASNTAHDSSVFVKTAIESLNARMQEIAQKRKEQQDAVRAARPQVLA